MCSPKRLPDYPNVPAVAETLPGYEIAAGGPKEFGDLWKAEVARYQKLINDAKITA